MKTNKHNFSNLKAIVNKLNNANKKQLLEIATKILDGEINSFADYQGFVEQ